MISLIVARARNGAIGRDGTIPWHTPEDLAFFRRETTGGVLIMGRRTWESLPVRPLPDRLNLVVSSDPGVAPQVFPTPAAAVEHGFSAGHRRLYGIGGTALFRDMLPTADRLLVTEVDLDVDDADTFFPEVDLTRWRAAGQTLLRSAHPRCVLHEFLR